MQSFTEDHRALLQRVQNMKKELADWRERAAVRNTNYTDQLKELQNEILNSMKQLKEDYKMMKSKVRVVLDKHDPAWREKQSGGHRR